MSQCNLHLHTCAMYHEVFTPEITHSGVSLWVRPAHVNVREGFTQSVPKNKTRTKQKTHRTHDKQREVDTCPAQSEDRCFIRMSGGTGKVLASISFFRINRSTQHPGWCRQWYVEKWKQVLQNTLKYGGEKQTVLDECYTCLWSSTLGGTIESLAWQHRWAWFIADIADHC